MKQYWLWIGLIVLVGGNMARGQIISDTGGMEVFDTEYYTIYTDMGYEIGKEAELRMTALFEEYRRRMAGFRGGINERMPFYICGTLEGYCALGGRRGSAGFFNWDEGILVALGDPNEVDYDDLWSTVQHEAFHQFAYYVISDDMPIWLNEAMAEYFERTIWTGDGFVTDVVSPYDYHWVLQMITEQDVRSFQAMVCLTPEQWNSEFTHTNYIQAWSMLYFFLSAQNGRYRSGLGRHINDIDQGRDSARSFEARVGDDYDALRDEYVDWWMSHETNPGQYKDYEAIVATLTSFLGRAAAQRQYFDSAEEFFTAARNDDLECHRNHWLPPQLLDQALNPPALFDTQQNQIDQIFSAPPEARRAIYDRLRDQARTNPPRAEDLGQWTLTRRGRNATLTLTLDDGAVLEGSFRVTSGRVSRVEVEITPGQPATNQDDPDQDS